METFVLGRNAKQLDCPDHSGCRLCLLAAASARTKNAGTHTKESRRLRVVAERYGGALNCPVEDRNSFDLEPPPSKPPT
jgi:hypothetical protein